MFIYDKVVQEAICPERRLGLGDELSAIAGVTHCYVSNDLQVVKVYVSIYSDEKGKQRALTNLQRLAPYVRSQIGQRVRLRLTPEIRFEYDDSVEEYERVLDALGRDNVDRYVAEAAAEAEGGHAVTGAAEGVGSRALGGNDEDGDEDGGFFDAVAEGEEEEEDEWAEEEEEDEMEYVEEPAGAFFRRPGPFDDLFAGDDEPLGEDVGSGGSGGGSGGGAGERRGAGSQRRQRRSGVKMGQEPKRRK